MMYDLRGYLGENQRVQDSHSNSDVAAWVESTYAGIVESALYAHVSEDGQWIVDTVPLPLLPMQYQGKEKAVELLRRRFVMDGWVRSEVVVNPQARNVEIVLAGPRDALLVDTAEGEIIPELNPKESIGEAIQRFVQFGVVYYTTPWERVTVPPHGIRRIYQRVPDRPKAEVTSMEGHG